jgi:predicted membrane protein
MSSEDKFDADKVSEDLHERIHRDIHNRVHEDAQSQFRKARQGGVQLHLGARSGGLWPGLILVIIGAVVLLDHMGIISSERLWRFWPAILIAVGAFKFFQECNRVFGAILMLAGGVLLLNNLGYTHLSWWDIWPLALIAAGIALIWSRFELPQRPIFSSGIPDSQARPNSPAGPNSLNEYSLFGGVERRIHSSQFNGGTVTALFGGVEVDFRTADIEGEEAVVYVEAIFGGIELTVPDNWAVVYEGQSIFGGFSDETRPPLPEVPGARTRKRLILRGRALFGGIVVKS